jgi:hypothetical protein
MSAPTGSVAQRGDQPPGILAPWDNTPSVVDDEDGSLDLEGAGIFSSYSEFGEKLGGDDGFQTAWAAASVALDTLGFIANPFESLLSAGLGWVMEHISFLHEGLDALAGDPEQIKAAAQAWHTAAQELTAIADELRGPGAPASGPATPPPGWDGVAAGAFGIAAAERAHRIDVLAAQGERLAISLLRAGATIATVRSIIRDAIADFIAGAVEKLLGGVLLGPETLGGATAAAIGWVVEDALALAARNAERIAELVSRLGEAGRALADGVREAARVLSGTSAGGLHSRVEGLDDGLGNAQVDKVVEGGNQYSDTDWEDPAAQPG